MSQPAQVELRKPSLKLKRRDLILLPVQISSRVLSIMLPMPRSSSASIEATQLHAITVPSGKIIGPLYSWTQVSLRLLTTLNFIADGNSSRVMRPLAEVYDQVKSNAGSYFSRGWKS